MIGGPILEQHASVGPLRKLPSFQIARFQCQYSSFHRPSTDPPHSYRYSLASLSLSLGSTAPFFRAQDLEIRLV